MAAHHPLPAVPPVREAPWAELAPDTAYGIAMLRGMVFVVEQQSPYLDLDGRDLEPGARQLWIAEPPVAAQPAAPATPVHSVPVHSVPGGTVPGGTVPTGTVPGGIVAALRLLPEERGWRIGRVVTAPTHRRRGLAEALMRRALDRPGPFVLDAQTPLTGWYSRFGFVVHGSEFVEDGIPHTPMRRP